MGLTWPEKRSRSRARASSVFCERKRRDPEEPGDDADLLLEPLQFGTVDAALEVQYRVRSESSDPAARRD